MSAELSDHGLWMRSRIGDGQDRLEGAGDGDGESERQ